MSKWTALEVRNLEVPAAGHKCQCSGDLNFGCQLFPGMILNRREGVRSYIRYRNKGPILAFYAT